VGASDLLDFGAGRGTKAVTAVYGGDANFAAGTSMAAHQVVSKAATTTTVTSSINPSSAGKNVEFTAVVNGAVGGIATGTVTFYDGTTTLGTVHERGEGESHNFKTEPRYAPCDSDV